jgi:hypothetical protein
MTYAARRTRLCHAFKLSKRFFEHEKASEVCKYRLDANEQVDREGRGIHIDVVLMGRLMLTAAVDYWSCNKKR